MKKLLLIALCAFPLIAMEGELSNKNVVKPWIPAKKTLGNTLNDGTVITVDNVVQLASERCPMPEGVKKTIDGKQSELSGLAFFQLTENKNEDLYYKDYAGLLRAIKKDKVQLNVISDKVYENSSANYIFEPQNNESNVIIKIGGGINRLHSMICSIPNADDGKIVFNRSWEWLAAESKRLKQLQSVYSETKHPGFSNFPLQKMVGYQTFQTMSRLAAYLMVDQEVQLWQVPKTYGCNVTADSYPSDNNYVVVQEKLSDFVSINQLQKEQQIEFWENMTKEQWKELIKVTLKAGLFNVNGNNIGTDEMLEKRYLIDFEQPNNEPIQYFFNQDTAKYLGNGLCSIGHELNGEGQLLDTQAPKKVKDRFENEYVPEVLEEWPEYVALMKKNGRDNFLK